MLARSRTLFVSHGRRLPGRLPRLLERHHRPGEPRPATRRAAEAYLRRPGGRLRHLPGQQLLEHPGHRPRRRLAQRRLAVAHVARQQAAPRLRQELRRAAGAVRHPDHRRRRQPREGRRDVPLPPRERPRAVPVRRRHHDRGWPRQQGRPARDRRRLVDLRAVRDLEHEGQERQLVRRAPAPPGTCTATSCAATAGPRPMPPGCRSSPACCGTTRSRWPGRSRTRSASPPT